jgi:phosphatidate cytidylyltransferase
MYWNKFAFAGIFMVFAVIGLMEFYRMAANETVKPQKVSGIISGALIYIAIALFAHNLVDYRVFFILLPVFCFIIISELYRNKEHPFTNIAMTLFGICYVAFPLAALNFFFSPFLLRGESNPGLLLSFFIILWTSDTMAYLSGRTFGKHHLFERISPKKTWEGSIGGAIFGVAAAWIISLFLPEFPLIPLIIISIIIIVFGTLGDLAESMLKRSAGVKDSGTIMPGHGGVLDRFDGVLLAAPAVLFYLLLQKLF